MQTFSSPLPSISQAQARRAEKWSILHNPLRAHTHTHQSTPIELPTSPTGFTEPTQKKKIYVENYEREYISVSDRVHSLRSPTQNTDGWNDLFELMEHSLAEQISKNCWRPKGYIFICSTNPQEEIIVFFSQTCGSECRLCCATALLELLHWELRTLLNHAVELWEVWVWTYNHPVTRSEIPELPEFFLFVSTFGLLNVRAAQNCDSEIAVGSMIPQKSFFCLSVDLFRNVVYFYYFLAKLNEYFPTRFTVQTFPCTRVW